MINYILSPFSLETIELLILGAGLVMALLTICMAILLGINKISIYTAHKIISYFLYPWLFFILIVAFAWYIAIPLFILFIPLARLLLKYLKERLEFGKEYEEYLKNKK